MVLFDEHDTALRAVLADLSDCIGRIVDYRNDLTHHPLVEERPEVDRIELVQCNYVLRILLELCFLKSMSIGRDQITNLALRCDRYQQIKRRFFPDKA